MADVGGGQRAANLEDRACACSASDQGRGSRLDIGKSGFRDVPAACWDSKAKMSAGLELRATSLHIGKTKNRSMATVFAQQLASNRRMGGVIRRVFAKRWTCQAFHGARQVAYSLEWTQRGQPSAATQCLLRRLRMVEDLLEPLRRLPSGLGSRLARVSGAKRCDATRPCLRSVSSWMVRARSACSAERVESRTSRVVSAG